MINDLPQSVLDNIVSIFANDTRVTKIIKDKSDIEKLQNDIKHVDKWQKNNNLLLNANKSLILSDMDRIKNSRKTYTQNQVV